MFQAQLLFFLFRLVLIEYLRPTSTHSYALPKCHHQEILECVILRMHTRTIGQVSPFIAVISVASWCAPCARNKHTLIGITEHKFPDMLLAFFWLIGGPVLGTENHYQSFGAAVSPQCLLAASALTKKTLCGKTTRSACVFSEWLTRLLYILYFELTRGARTKSAWGVG